MTFVFSDLKRTEDGRRQKLCKTSLSMLIAYGPCDSRSGQQWRDRAAFDMRIWSSSSSRPCSLSSPLSSSSDGSQGSDGSRRSRASIHFVPRCHRRISVLDERRDLVGEVVSLIARETNVSTGLRGTWPELFVGENGSDGQPHRLLRYFPRRSRRRSAIARGTGQPGCPRRVC